MNANIYLSATALVLLFGAIFALASSSIGVECYNINEQMKKDKQSNFGFLITNIVCNILLILSASVSMYISFTSQRVI